MKERQSPSTGSTLKGGRREDFIKKLVPRALWASWRRGDRKCKVLRGKVNVLGILIRGGSEDIGNDEAYDKRKRFPKELGMLL
jgi:hypothetical protein